MTKLSWLSSYNFFIVAVGCFHTPSWFLQIDPDKAFAVQIAHEENVVTSNVSYIQCALLYTSSSGERRIRSALHPPAWWRSLYQVRERMPSRLFAFLPLLCGLFDWLLPEKTVYWILNPTSDKSIWQREHDEEGFMLVCSRLGSDICSYSKNGL